MDPHHSSVCMIYVHGSDTEVRPRWKKVLPNDVFIWGILWKVFGVAGLFLSD